MATHGDAPLGIKKTSTSIKPPVELPFTSKLRGPDCVICSRMNPYSWLPTPTFRQP